MHTLQSNSVNLMHQAIEIVTTQEEIELGLKRIERFGHICYQSSGRTSREKFIRSLIKSNHTSVLEHLSLSVILTTDRTVTHQLVRHRLTSVSMESQRYCNYSLGKFHSRLNVILPQSLYKPGRSVESYTRFVKLAEDAYSTYQFLLSEGCNPEDARSVLPNATKAQVAITANLAEWRHIFKHRCAKAAQPQVRALMIAFVKALEPWSYIVDDIPLCMDGIYKMPDIPEVPNIEYEII